MTFTHCEIRRTLHADVPNDKITSGHAAQDQCVCFVGENTLLRMSSDVGEINMITAFLRFDIQREMHSC